MDHATQISLTKQVFGHIAEGTTDLAPAMVRRPIANYACDARLLAEREKLFGRQPLFMGLSCILPEKGSYVAEELSGVPLLLTRDNAGVAHGFLNVCRHRGARLVSGRGRSRRQLVCPYHAWGYDHGGNLINVPDEASFEGLDKSCNGLIELPMIEKDGMIWLKTRPGDGFDIDEHLSGLAPELANYGLASYYHWETRVLQHKINWKIAIDTFLEPYHFGFLHANTVGPIFIPNLCLFEGFGAHLRETLPRRTIVELRDQPEADWNLITHTALVYVLFPNTVFVMQADHVETWRVFPVGNKADECVMYLDFFIPEPAESDSARRHWERNMDLAIRTVVEEDFPTGETIQFGFQSGAQDHLTFGRNEPALIHFEQSIDAALAD